MRLGLRLRLRLGLRLRFGLQFRCNLDASELKMKMKANLSLNKLSRVGVGGWLEQLEIKLISTQVVVEVEVGVELAIKFLYNL